MTNDGLILVRHIILLYLIIISYVTWSRLFPRSLTSVNRDHLTSLMGDYRQRFNELCKQDTDGQCQFFLKSFILSLGDDWKKVVELSKKYVKYLELARKDEPDIIDLNAAQAADFLQQNGKTRTVHLSPHCPCCIPVRLILI